MFGGYCTISFDCVCVWFSWRSWRYWLISTTRDICFRSSRRSCRTDRRSSWRSSNAEITRYDVSKSFKSTQINSIIWPSCLLSDPSSNCSHCVATLDMLLTSNCCIWGRRRETNSFASPPGGIKSQWACLCEEISSSSSSTSSSLPSSI